MDESAMYNTLRYALKPYKGQPLLINQHGRNPSQRLTYMQYLPVLDDKTLTFATDVHVHRTRNSKWKRIEEEISIPLEQFRTAQTRQWPWASDPLGLWTPKISLSIVPGEDLVSLYFKINSKKLFRPIAEMWSKDKLTDKQLHDIVRTIDAEKFPRPDFTYAQAVRMLYIEGDKIKKREGIEREPPAHYYLQLIQSKE